MYASVEAPAQDLIKSLRSSLAGYHFELTGAIRRQEDTIANIEIVTNAGLTELTLFFERFDAAVINKEAENIVIALEGAPDITFYLTTKSNFYERLFTTTASDEFSQHFKAHYSIAKDIKSEEEIFTKARP